MMTIEDRHEHSQQHQPHCPSDHPGAMLREDFLPDYGLTVLKS